MDDIIVVALEQVRTVIRDGLPSAGIPPLDPFHIEQLKVDMNASSAVYRKFNTFIHFSLLMTFTALHFSLFSTKVIDGFAFFQNTSGSRRHGRDTLVRVHHRIGRHQLTAV